MMSSEKRTSAPNLRSMSEVQLKSLLLKQQALLKNKFVEKLQDKGLKIRSLIGEIQKELTERSTKISSTTLELERMNLNIDERLDSYAVKQNTTTELGESSSDQDNISLLAGILNNGSSGKIYVNSYQKVIDRSHSQLNHRAKFCPNSTLKEGCLRRPKISTNNEIAKLTNSNTSTSLPISPVNDNIGDSCSSANIVSAIKPGVDDIAATGRHLTVNLDSNERTADCSIANSSSSAKIGDWSTNQHDDIKPSRRQKHGYDESLAPLEPLQHSRTLLIDFEESFALIHQQLLKAHPNSTADLKHVSDSERYKDGTQWQTHRGHPMQSSRLEDLSGDNGDSDDDDDEDEKEIDYD